VHVPFANHKYKHKYKYKACDAAIDLQRSELCLCQDLLCTLPQDFESLEDNQVLVQGMMANRYMNTFRDDILVWNKQLMNVADVNQIMSEIQRTWAYLESLFIHSEEVKKELPEATERFANIDREVCSC
jgi:Dynein heavy chain, N-terminal region 2